MSDWQPISSAPKDGRDVLVFWHTRRILVARWIENSMVHDGQSVWMVAGGGVIEPTKWMPLPDPPKD